MRTFREKCESTNTVRSFCDCIGKDRSADVAAKGFCRRASENSTSVTGDELVELKKALKDLEGAGEGTVTYTDADLKSRILEMYPEIVTHNVGVDMKYDDAKNAYVLAFSRGKDVLTTHLDKRDADECVHGIKCVYLGIQVAQFIRNFEERVVFGRQAA